MKLRFAFLFFASLLLSLPSKSQDPKSEIGAIRGQVFDGITKELLFGANVQLVGTNIGATTDLEGQFVIPRVPVGTHSLRISALGYSTYVRTDVIVAVARPTEVMIPLVESSIIVDAVQVTASYFQKNPDTPLSSLTQTNEEIRRLPGGLEDVVRAISILPGVAQVQAGRNDLIVRGGAPSENLFVIVEGTSFSTGGFGARYGDKLSSVLALELREGRKDALGGKVTISASQFGLNLEGPLSESGNNFIFSARRSYLDFIFKAAGFGFVPEYWDFLGKTHFNLTPKDQIVAFGILALDNVRLFNETAEKRFNNSRILANDQVQFVGSTSWRHIMDKAYPSDVR
jgi:hypothetical protein